MDVPADSRQLYHCDVCGQVVGGLDGKGDGWWSTLYEHCRHYRVNSALLAKVDDKLAKEWASKAKYTWRDADRVYYAIPTGIR